MDGVSYLISYRSPGHCAVKSPLHWHSPHEASSGGNTYCSKSLHLTEKLLFPLMDFNGGHWYVTVSPTGMGGDLFGLRPEVSRFSLDLGGISRSCVHWQWDFGAKNSIRRSLSSILFPCLSPLLCWYSSIMNFSWATWQQEAPPTKRPETCTRLKILLWKIKLW